MKPWISRMNSMLRADGVVEELLVGLGLDAPREERRFDVRGNGGGVGAVAHGEVVDRRQRPGRRTGRARRWATVMPAIAEGGVVARARR